MGDRDDFWENAVKSLDSATISSSEGYTANSYILGSVDLGAGSIDHLLDYRIPVSAGSKFG